jgi:hypothetical protein
MKKIDELRGDEAHEAVECAQECGRLLMGLPPEIQAAALLDLVATYLAGWPTPERQKVLNDFLAHLPGMIEVNERIRFGDAGHPENKREH